MQETGQPDEDTTVNSAGEFVDDEIVTKFYEEISTRSKRSTELGKLTSNGQKYYIINSESKNYIDDGTSANALSYAIHHESYFIVKQMFDDLRWEPFNEMIKPIIATDEDGNNALQKLICTIEHGGRWLEKCEETVKGIVDTVVNCELSFDLLTYENNGKTALTLALMSTKSVINDHTMLFISLMGCIVPGQQGDAILEKQLNCSSDECNPEGTGHISSCTAGYNLLMLALTSKNRTNINYLLDVVLGADVDVKLKIVIGNPEGTLNTNLPNSIRTAAKNEQWDALKHLVEFVIGVQTVNLADLLVFDEDERLDSAMKWIVRGNGCLLEYFLRLSGSTLRNDLDARFRSNIYRNRFINMEMSLESIKAFYRADLFVDSFLLPKPCRREEQFTQPRAMICCNTFKPDQKLYREGMRIGSERIQQALNDLGWQVEREDSWSFAELKDKIEGRLTRWKRHASIFLLCITTHGNENHIMGQKENPKEDHGHINEIVKIVQKNTEPFIPKVVIIDTCREQAKTPRDEQVVISEGNMLLLLGTSYGRKGKAGLYLGELAEQIEKADGATTLEEMHYEATKNIKDTKYQSARIAQFENQDGSGRQEQDPQKLSAAKRIKLRNWNKASNVCNKVGHGEPLTCHRCTGNVCLKCIGLYAGSDVLQHTDVRLYCKACCQKVGKG